MFQPKKNSISKRSMHQAFSLCQKPDFLLRSLWMKRRTKRVKGNFFSEEIKQQCIRQKAICKHSEGQKDRKATYLAYITPRPFSKVACRREFYLWIRSENHCHLSKLDVALSREAKTANLFSAARYEHACLPKVMMHWVSNHSLESRRNEIHVHTLSLEWLLRLSHDELFCFEKKYAQLLFHFGQTNCSKKLSLVWKHLKQFLLQATAPKEAPVCRRVQSFHSLFTSLTYIVLGFIHKLFFHAHVREEKV